MTDIVSDNTIANEMLHETIEYPWKRCFVAFLRKSALTEMVEANYQFSTELPGFVRKHWDKVKKLTLVDPFRMGKIVDLVIRTKDIPGDILEFGSYKGGTGILMGLLLKELGSDKKIHLFDSFEGLPDPDTTKDKGYRKGQFRSNYDKLQAEVEQYGLTDIITLHRGWFSDTVEPFIAANNSPKVSILHLDCDLYTSTMDCFPQTYPLISEGGAIILDDFNDGGRGEKRAVIECLRALESTACFVACPGSQSYFIKNQAPDEFAIQDLDMYYDVVELASNEPFLTWIEKDIEEDYLVKLEALLAANK